MCITVGKCGWWDNIKMSITETGGYAIAQLLEVLHYKPQGHGFDSCWES
jgi:hypothetical protein